MANNYVIGRGRAYFEKFVAGQEVGSGKNERYLGNTPEFNLTAEIEEYEHFSSEEGTKELDLSVALSTTRSGSLIAEDIKSENIALFFLGSSSALSVAGATITDEAIDDVSQGLYYQLGQSAVNPAGHKGLELFSVGPDVNIVVTDDSVGPVTFTELTDYTIDMARGRLYIVPGGAIVDGTNLRVDYKVATSTRARAISGSTQVEGALRFTSYNPVGEEQDVYLPKVRISPNGDFAMISDEVRQIPLTIKVLKPSDREAIYVDGAAVI